MSLSNEDAPSVQLALLAAALKEEVMKLAKGRPMTVNCLTFPSEKAALLRELEQNRATIQRQQEEIKDLGLKVSELEKVGTRIVFPSILRLPVNRFPSLPNQPAQREKITIQKG
jgi:hypothetical protein